MKPGIIQNLIILSSVALTGVGLIGYIDYKTNQKLVNSEQWVQHTERVIYESGNIFLVAKDLELASQGCVITNDSIFLKLNMNPQVIFTSIGQLRQLTVDNPAQQARIDSLTLYVKWYLNFLVKTVDLRTKKGFAAAVALISTRQGKLYADCIARITASIQQEESRLLKQRMQTNEHRVGAFKTYSIATLIVIGVFAILLLIASAKNFLQSKEKEKRAQEIKLAEEKIEFDRNNLAALINNTEDMMWSIDMDLRLITFNEAFNKFVILTAGRPPRRGDNVLSSHANENRWNTFKILYEKALKGESFTILDRLDYPAESWSEVSFRPLRQGDMIIGTACFSRDVTQRTATDRAFHAMEQEMDDQKVQEQKKITRAILNAQEKERNHIGQELHDNISQILASSKLFLSTAGNQNEAVKDLVRYPMELIDSSIQEIRLLSSRHVTPIKDVDLRELVQSLLDSLRENTLINTAFNYDVGNQELSDDLKLNIYRIIQEQINNIVKHASPGKIVISLKARHNALHIEMKDDGKGFDVKKKRKGIGLSNMMNRIESFNGQMFIESSLGQGCSVQIDIPY
jgi:two-component system NarL family sensor kinase